MRYRFYAILMHATPFLPKYKLQVAASAWLFMHISYSQDGIMRHDESRVGSGHDTDGIQGMTT
jgi:hypothetical protein